eukprot:4725678-Amphidinium_carterae.1
MGDGRAKHRQPRRVSEVEIPTFSGESNIKAKWVWCSKLHGSRTGPLKHRASLLILNGRV